MLSRRISRYKIIYIEICLPSSTGGLLAAASSNNEIFTHWKLKKKKTKNFNSELRFLTLQSLFLDILDVSLETLA